MSFASIDRWICLVLSLSLCCSKEICFSHSENHDLMIFFAKRCLWRRPRGLGLDLSWWKMGWWNGWIVLLTRRRRRPRESLLMF
jgi:hypothetical protein